MNSKILREEDFYDYAVWHEWLEDNQDRYDWLDRDSVLFYGCYDSRSLENSCDQKTRT